MKNKTHEQKLEAAKEHAEKCYQRFMKHKTQRNLQAYENACRKYEEAANE